MRIRGLFEIDHRKVNLENNIPDFFKLLERITELLDEPAFQEKALEFLYNEDRYAYEDLIKERVIKVISENEYIQEILRYNGHLASSFQYISPNFGDYLRCRYPIDNNPFGAGGPGFKLSAVEEANIENLRTERLALRELSLLFCDDLIEPLQVQFGGKQFVTSEAIFHVGQEIWENLETDLCGEKKEKNFIEVIVGRNTQELEGLIKKDKYKIFLNEFRKHLENNSLLVKKELRRLKLEDDSILFRVFLLSYFYSIMRQKECNLEPNSHFTLIIPINLTSSPKKFFLNKVSTYCGAFKNPVGDNHIQLLEYALRQISSRLLELEWISIKTPRRINIAVVENLIRLCTEIQDEPPIEIADCKEMLRNLLINHPKDEREEFQDDLIQGIFRNFCTADPDMLDLLKSMASAIPKNEKERIMFFFSEPGGGKETLAHLCHLISPRSWNKDMIEKQVAIHEKEVKRSYRNYSDFIDESSGILDEDRKLKCKDWNKNRIKFNFRSLNCAQATEDSLWGDKEEPGEFVKAHLLFGTLFLDEIDKIKRGLTDQLLRVLEEPREVYPKKGVKPIPVRLLLVFASNEPIDRLERKGFSGAFISRVEQYYFAVPPLRERVEDIPLLVNHFIRLYNEEQLEKVKDEEEAKFIRSNKFIRYIDIKGLKLLMNLKWEYNFRALKSFANDLCKMKELKNSPKSVRLISFEEVLDCLIKRGLLYA